MCGFLILFRFASLQLTHKFAYLFGGEGGGGTWEFSQLLASNYLILITQPWLNHDF